MQACAGEFMFWSPLENSLEATNMIKFWIFVLILNSTSALNILAILPHVGKSHFAMFRPLMINLAERGHNITVVSHFPNKRPMENYVDINLAGTMHLWESAFRIDEMISNDLKRIIWSEVRMARLSRKSCQIMMDDQRIRDFFPDQFDVVIIEQFNSDCGMALVHQLGSPPIIGIVTHVPRPCTNARFGLLENPSYISVFGRNEEQWEAIESLRIWLYNMASKWSYYFLSQLPEQAFLRTRFGNDLPPLEILAKNMSLLLTNTYFLFNGAHPMPKSVIEVGGIHLHYGLNFNISKDMQNLLDNSKNGVVLFSMGSLIIGNTWPKQSLKAFFEAFTEFPQDFIWKWENGTLDEAPDNVKFFPWIPQPDILCHENTKAFISHGGMLSMIEALHCGVPVLIIPSYGDQFSNAANARDAGFGVLLRHDNITKDSVVWGLTQILSTGMQENAKRMSKVWKDRPMSPMDTAVYWIEHVARHGGKHLRSPTVDLPFYRYLMIDSIALLILSGWLAYKIVTTFALKLFLQNKRKKKHD